LFLTIVASLLVVGCAHVISNQVLNEVDKNATFAQALTTVWEILQW
jgi:outer membrane biogenesis lipoprotein LolB